MIHPLELHAAGAMPVPRIAARRVQIFAEKLTLLMPRSPSAACSAFHAARCVLTYGRSISMSSRAKKSTQDPAAGGTDTRSFEQLQGRQDPKKAPPNRRNEKMPHERDESARSTGNRLDEQVPPSERQISQAQDDVRSGQVDTDRRGIPNDVPSDKR
jgi:hypothetical protein